MKTTRFILAVCVLTGLTILGGCEKSGRFQNSKAVRFTASSARDGVTKSSYSGTGTFDENGWLTVGFAGHQLHFGETYISTGSVYLCTEGLVALGLPETDPFWSDPAADWTSKKGWAGVDMPVDHAINF